MKRSEMVKKLATYMYNTEARTSEALQFLEDQGMTHHYGWDPEEDPKPLPIEVQIQVLVGNHMGWTGLQALNWYMQMNPLLGGLSPNDMVCQGRQDQLLKWINNALDENVNDFMNENKELMEDLAKQEELDKQHPKLPQKNAVKKLAALSKARRKKFKPSKKLRKALGRKK